MIDVIEICPLSTGEMTPNRQRGCVFKKRSMRLGAQANNIYTSHTIMGSHKTQKVRAITVDDRKKHDSSIERAYQAEYPKTVNEVIQQVT